MTIKRGVTLYSYQDEFVRGKMSVEDCVAFSASVGAVGIESLAEQMFPGYPMPGGPDLPDSFYSWWHGLMAKYGTTTTVHDLFLDTKIRKDRMMTQEEMVESVKRDIRHAAKLGAAGIRVIVNTPPEVVEAAAPYARDHGIWLGVEVHPPYSFHHEWIERHLEVASRVGSDVVGCVPDLGIFVRRYPRVMYEQSLRQGADPKIAPVIRKTYDEGGDCQGLLDRLQSEGADPATVGIARQATFMIAEPASVLEDHADLIKHIHGKFFEMLPAEAESYPHEYSIPYDEIIPVLKKIGYDGYISSEYEGNRHIDDVRTVDSREQIRRHHEMLRTLIGEETSDVQ